MITDLDVIERVIDIAASPETVFTLLTDPEQYVRWKGTRAKLELGRVARSTLASRTAGARWASTSRSSPIAASCSPGAGMVRTRS